eukprot:3345688-Amphidinium_carterae.3
MENEQFSQPSQDNTCNKAGAVQGCLGRLPLNLCGWLGSAERCVDDDVLHTLLFLAMTPSVPSEVQAGQHATATYEPLYKLAVGSLLVLWSVACKATSATRPEKPSSESTGHSANQRTPH